MLTYQGHSILEITDADIAGKRVFLRADFNVPVAKDNSIIDDYRLRAALPTLVALFERGARAIIVGSHLGRPKGRFEPGLSLMPVAAWVQEKTGRKVVMAEDVAGPSTRKLVEEAGEGSIVFLENLRFDEREEQNDAAFAKELAALADIYINDAFGASHRAHASVSAITQFLPSYAGLLVAKEINALAKAITDPEPPLVAIIGGAKVADKISVMESLAKRGYAILIGGAMANTFLKAGGINIGASVCEPKELETANKLLAAYPDALVLPEDAIIAPDLAVERGDNVLINNIPAEAMILDIGTTTVARYAEAVASAKTIIWAGPLGYSENKAFRAGTETVAKTVDKTRSYCVAGGGDTISIIDALGIAQNFDHISTGGSAMLDFLAGNPMPALDALIKVQSYK